REALHAHAALGPHGDVASHTPWLAFLEEGEASLAEQRGERDAELVVREGGTEAASVAAAEGRVLVRPEGALEEALGTEGLGLRVELLVLVQELDARRHRHPRRQLVLAEPEGLKKRAHELGHRRPEAQDL